MAKKDRKVRKTKRSPKLYFVTGLPRSGSTLLMNVLGQNPEFHVTGTNDLIDLMVTIRNRWTQTAGFQAQGLDKIQPRVENAIEGMLYGFYKEELAAGKIVFDKSRGWMAWIELLEKVLGHEVRMVCTIRDVRAIIASFEKVYRKPGAAMMRPTQNLQGFVTSQTTEGRAAQWLAPDATVGMSVNRLRDVFTRGMQSRLILFPYSYFTEHPKTALEGLHEGLGLDPFEYDFDNVKQITREDDYVHGFDLHTTRPKIEPQQGVPWEGVLPRPLAQSIADQYQDINQIADAWRQPGARISVVK